MIVLCLDIGIAVYGHLEIFALSYVVAILPGMKCLLFNYLADGRMSGHLSILSDNGVELHRLYFWKENKLKDITVEVDVTDFTQVIEVQRIKKWRIFWILCQYL